MLVMPPKERKRREREEYEKRQNEVIEGLLNNFDEETVEGDNLTIDNCAIAPLKEFKICGKEMVQETREGYNQVDFASPYFISPNTNFSFDNDTIEVGATGPYRRAVWNILELIKKNMGKTLKFKYEYIDYAEAIVDSIQLRIVTNNNANYVILVKQGQNDVTYTIPEDVSNITEFLLGIYSNNSNTDDASLIKITKPMLVFEEDADKPYEKFGQSPSLEYPSPLEYVKYNQKVLYTNENVIDFFKYLYKNNLGIDIKSTDSKIILNGTPTKNYVNITDKIDITDILQDGEKYTLFRENDNKVYVQINALKYNGSVDMISLNVNNTATITVDKSIYKTYTINIQLNTISIVGTLENYLVKCMFVKGDYTPKKYIASKSENYQIDLIENFTHNYVKEIPNANIDKNNHISSANGYSLIVIKANASNYNFKLKSYNQLVISSSTTLPNLNEYVSPRLVVDNNEADYTLENNGYLIVRYAQSVYATKEDFFNDLIITSDAGYLYPLYSENDKIIYLKADDKNANDGEGWYVYNEWSQDLINGNSNVNYSNALNCLIYLNDKIFNASSGHQNDIYCYCDKSNGNTLYNVGNLLKNGICCNSSSNRLLIRFEGCEQYNTVELAKQYFTENPYTVIYKLETPTYTKITDEILVKQLDKLRAMFTSEGTNHFIVTSENGQSANLKAIVYKDTFKILKEEIDNLKALLLES